MGAVTRCQSVFGAVDFFLLYPDKAHYAPTTPFIGIRHTCFGYRLE